MRLPCRFIVPLVLLLVGLLAAVAAAAEGSPPEAVAPKEVVHLFNGKDLAGWTTWLKGTGRADPEKVYSVEDGVIHVTGKGAGYLATDKPYKNYHLIVDYKWGQRTDGSGNVRNAGVLLHGIGPDGGAGGVWMTCLECQLAQGCEGDLIVIRGKDPSGKIIPATITCETEIASDGKTRWKPGGKKTVYSGSQFWWSKHEPGFEEKLDTRGRWDVASPVGQWTRVECICDGDRVTIKINGVTVNEALNVFPSAGKILLQNEGSEIYYRGIELRPLR
jgi:3-keto-disaccharide hydrolase